MKLKVCGMKYPQNLSKVLALKPDFIGLIFYGKSSRNMLQSLEFELIKGLAYVTKVGVFVNESPEKVERTAGRYGLDMVQLHGQESPDECAYIHKSGIPVIKAFSVDEAFDFANTESYASSCDYFLFDTKGALPGGNGRQFDWQLLKAYQGSTPFFLSGGINPTSIDALRKFDHPALFAIDVNSGFEKAPGLKDTAKLAEFIDAIN